MHAVSASECRFRQRLVQVRRLRKLTQGQLGDACGLSFSAISRIETGKRAVGLGEAFSLCRALGVSLIDMTDREPMKLRLDIPVD